MTRHNPGDLIEIKTAKGLAYAQYTHKRPSYGHLIRVIDGFFESRPENLGELAARPTRFSIFFPLGVAISRRLVEKIGCAPIPAPDQRFPTFRSTLTIGGKATVWWLWDGDKAWKVKELTAEQRKLSVRGIWNHTLLIERIEQGWKPEDDPR